MAANGSSCRTLVTQSLGIWSESYPEWLAFLCFDDEIVFIDGSFHLIPIDLLVHCDWSANFILGGVQIDPRILVRVVKYIQSASVSQSLVLPQQWKPLSL